MEYLETYQLLSECQAGFRKRRSTEDGIIETLFIEIISTTGKNIIVGTIYRPPSGNFEMFENKVNTILTEVDKTRKITYLTGILTLIF